MRRLRWTKSNVIEALRHSSTVLAKRVATCAIGLEKTAITSWLVLQLSDFCNLSRKSWHGFSLGSNPPQAVPPPPKKKSQAFGAVSSYIGTRHE